MKFPRWVRRYLPLAIALTGLPAGACAAQAASQGGAAQPPAGAQLAVQSVNVVKEKGRIGVQILTSRPILPRLTQITDQHIAVEVSQATFAPGQQVITSPSAQLKSVRTTQDSRNPPATRIEVDLSEPLRFSMVSSGNRSVLWFLLPPGVDGLAPPPAAAMPQQASPAPQQQQPTPLPASGPDAASPTQAMEQAMLPGGRTINAPATIPASSDTTVINIPRGGQVHVCPNTSLSVTTSQNGRNLMLGMSTGALETHYVLPLGAADVVLTPDFRILLPGPGAFAFAISADRQGNTCVRSLEGNTASVVVSELMGDDNAQVGPNEQVVFRSGRVKNVNATATPECGCPRPVVPVLQAQTPAPPPPQPAQTTPVPAASPAASPPVSTPPVLPAPTPAETARAQPPPTATAPVNPNELHVQVEAPFVFRASEAAPPPPAVAHLRLASSTPSALRDTRVEPPALVSFYRVQGKPTAEKPQRRGFFGKLRGFFGGIFH